MTPDQRAHLRALAERVRTEEPSEELRDAALLAMGWTRQSAPTSWVLRDPKGIPKIFPPNPLTSRDAAAKVMRKGWIVDRIAQRRDAWWVTLWKMEYGFVEASAPTEPRARTAAALLAMAAEGEA